MKIPRAEVLADVLTGNPKGSRSYCPFIISNERRFCKMAKEKTRAKNEGKDARRFALVEFQEADKNLAETKEAIIILADSKRKVSLPIALLVEQVAALAIVREEALERLADFDIMTETEAIKAALSMEGGAA